MAAASVRMSQEFEWKLREKEQQIEELQRGNCFYLFMQGVYDVSTTSSIKTSDEVLLEMERVLQQMNVDYKRKG